MINLKAFTEVIKKKSEEAVQALKRRLIDRTKSDLNASKSITNLRNAYLQQQISPNQDIPHPQSPKNRVHPIKSQHHFNAARLHHLRNSSSNTRNTPAKELQLKKEKLMQELKQIDLEMKSKHQDECLERLKRNRTEAEIDKQSYERAARLVEKMNRQRKQMAEKRVKETLVLKQNVQESLQKFKQLEELKKEEHLKKKIEIEKRIEARKLRAFQRDKLNKMSNQVIKEINSYKISLPQIYLKKYQTPPHPTQEHPQVLLTNLDEDERKGQLRYNRESRVSSFLENIHQQEVERRKVSQQKREYQKSIRERHIEFGNKVRQHQKLKLDLQKSQKRIERTHVSRAREDNRVAESQMESVSYIQEIQ